MAMKHKAAAAALALWPVACAHTPKVLIDPATPGSLIITVGTVGAPAADRAPSTESWLRNSTGVTTFGFLTRGREQHCGGLAAGVYDLCAKLELEHDRSWIYVEHEVAVRPGATTEVALDLPAERSARLALRVEKHTPPFYLLLAKPGTEFPSDLRALGKQLAQTAYPDGLVFALQSDGNEPDAELQRLPAGQYVLFQMANDWQLGDQLPQGRTLALELRAGRTTTVWLEDELARMRVE